jgi:hypothetical protein
MMTLKMDFISKRQVKENQSISCNFRESPTTEMRLFCSNNPIPKFLSHFPCVLEKYFFSYKSVRKLRRASKTALGFKYLKEGKREEEKEPPGRRGNASFLTYSYCMLEGRNDIGWLLCKVICCGQGCLNLMTCRTL